VARYLVTGAAGFIGARVAELLLEAGHHVTGVDNMNASYDVRMKEYRLGLLENREWFSFSRLDIAERKGMDKLSADSFDGVIHLAARAGVRDSVQDPWAYVDANMTGTLNMLELCRTQNVPKLVLASTSSVYGAGAPLPSRQALGPRPLLDVLGLAYRELAAGDHRARLVADRDVMPVIAWDQDRGIDGGRAARLHPRSHYGLQRDHRALTLGAGSVLDFRHVRSAGGEPTQFDLDARRGPTRPEVRVTGHAAARDGRERDGHLVVQGVLGLIGDVLDSFSDRPDGLASLLDDAALGFGRVSGVSLLRARTGYGDRECRHERNPRQSVDPHRLPPCKVRRWASRRR